MSYTTRPPSPAAMSMGFESPAAKRPRRQISSTADATTVSRQASSAWAPSAAATQETFLLAPSALEWLSHLPRSPSPQALFGDVLQPPPNKFLHEGPSVVLQKSRPPTAPFDYFAHHQSFHNTPKVAATTRPFTDSSAWLKMPHLSLASDLAFYYTYASASARGADGMKADVPASAQSEPWSNALFDPFFTLAQPQARPPDYPLDVGIDNTSSMDASDVFFHDLHDHQEHLFLSKEDWVVDLFEPHMPAWPQMPSGPVSSRLTPDLSVQPTRDDTTAKGLSHKRPTRASEAKTSQGEPQRQLQKSAARSPSEADEPAAQQMKSDNSKQSFKKRGRVDSQRLHAVPAGMQGVLQLSAYPEATPVSSQTGPVVVPGAPAARRKKRHHEREQVNLSTSKDVAPDTPGTTFEDYVRRRKTGVLQTGESVLVGVQGADSSDTSQQRTWVDAKTSEPGSAGAQGAISSTAYEKIRLVDPQTGEPVAADTPGAIAQTAYRRLKMVDPQTGEPVALGTQGAITQGAYALRKRLAAKT